MTRERRFIAAIAVLAAVSGLATAARANTNASGAHEAASTPIKECTRFNGRNGYYGNPWCSEAEQLAWDRWEANRLRQRK